MPTVHKREDFATSEEGTYVRGQLIKMEADQGYNTQASYSTSLGSIDGQISFVEKHMKYLQTHPGVDPTHYVANLRLMTKVRS